MNSINQRANMESKENIKSKMMYLKSQIQDDIKEMSSEESRDSNA